MALLLGGRYFQGSLLSGDLKFFLWGGVLLHTKMCLFDEHLFMKFMCVVKNTLVCILILISLAFNMY